jgi:hypothetical protein
MAKYWKGDHTTHKLRYHLVWIPKYRKRILRVYDMHFFERIKKPLMVYAISGLIVKQNNQHPEEECPGRLNHH